jgi:hypothetical protein
MILIVIEPLLLLLKSSVRKGINFANAERHPNSEVGADILPIPFETEAK